MYRVLQDNTTIPIPITLPDVVASTFYLITSGCLINGTRNCTLMCSESSAIWLNTTNATDINIAAPANLWNCLSFPLITNALRQGELDTESIKLAAAFGILNSSRIDLDIINKSTSACLIDYCTSDPKTCQYQTQWYGDVYEWGSWTMPQYPALCPTTFSVTSDIAGQGLLDAYYIQIGLLLVAWLALKFCLSWAEYLLWLLTLNRSRAKRWQKSISTSKRTGILVSSLASFQKAQCYFWLANSTAILISMRSAPDWKAPSWGQLLTDLEFLPFICFVGMVLITFGLFTLHMAKKRSLYMLLLSLAALTVSAIGAVNSGHFDPHAIKPTNPEASWAMSCGSVSPITYCPQFNLSRSISPQSAADTLGIYVNNSPEQIVLGLVLIMFTGLSIDFCVNEYTVLQSGLANLQPTFLKSFAHRRKRQGEVLSWLAMFGAQFILLYCNMAALIAMPSITSDEPVEWDFAQIVALLIWFPIVIEFVSAMFFGLEEASDHQIAKPYKLVRVDEAKASDSQQLSVLGSQGNSKKTADHNRFHHNNDDESPAN